MNQFSIYMLLRKFLISRFSAMAIFALMPWSSLWASSKEIFELEVSKPTFVLPQFTGAYQEREASIAPEEYETAEKLKTLLEEDDKEAVLKELEAFYDIEISPAMQTLKAQIYFSLEMHDKAEKTYLSILRRKPQLIRAHSDLAQLYLITDRPLKAREHFAKAVEFGSNDAQVHGQLAYLNLTQFGPFSAISEYQVAMALDPNNSQWQQGLLAALTKAGMFDGASALTNELLARNPTNTDLWLNKATLSLKQEQPQAALSSLEMALLHGDTSENNLRVAAQLHLQLKSFDRALELLEQHLQKVDFKMSTLNDYLGHMEQAGLWDDAEKLLAKAEKKVGKFSSSERSQYYLHRAIVNQSTGDLTSSKKYFEQAIEFDPMNGGALLRFAKFNVEQKNFPQAELLYIRAEALDETEQRAMLGRSQLYIETLDYSAALKHLRNVKTKFPDIPDLSEKIQIIENIARTNSRY